jgi:hypothetical protein
MARCDTPDRVRNVLEPVLARVGNRNFELTADLPVGIFREADAARGCNLLEPRGNVDAVAEHIALFDDDVANVDADAELDATLARKGGVALCHPVLHGNRAGDCFDDRRKRKQEAVTDGLDDLPIVRGNERINQLRAVRFQRQQRAFLVRAHEARIAHHVGGNDGSEVTLDRAGRHGHILFG